MAFAEIVVSTWGDKGREWLASLPQQIADLSTAWQLTDIRPVSNMTYHYVARVMRNGEPKVIKLGCDAKTVLGEYRALRHFNGQGMVSLEAFDEGRLALLLEQAIPGVPLKSQHLHINEMIAYYADVVAGISTKQGDTAQFPHMREWCQTVDRMSEDRFDETLVAVARRVRDDLLSTVKDTFVCHGDLHLDNVLLHGNGAIAIDPKGVVGELAFEVAAFDVLDDTEIESPDALSKIEERVEMLAVTFQLDQQRLLSWFFLRLMLSGWWFVEDGGCSSRVLMLARKFLTLGGW